MGSLTRALISLLPISTLTLLQFSSGKAIRFVVFFATLPALFGVIYQVGTIDDSPSQFISEIMLDVMLGTLLPIATLILATTAFGDEIDDRTLVYLVLKPISRLRIVSEKYLAVAETTILSLWFGLILTWIIAASGDLAGTADVLLAALVTILVGVAAYGAVFIAVSLIIPRALVVGILYVLIWESLLSRVIPGVWVLSIRHYVQSIYVRMVTETSLSLDNAVQLYSALPALLALITAALLLASLRLRTMDLE